MLKFTHKKDVKTENEIMKHFLLLYLMNFEKTFLRDFLNQAKLPHRLF